MFMICKEKYRINKRKSFNIIWKYITNEQQQIKYSKQSFVQAETLKQSNLKKAFEGELVKWNCKEKLYNWKEIKWKSNHRK